MSGRDGGTMGTRRPLGAVDPNDERFVPSALDVKPGTQKPQNVSTPRKARPASGGSSSTTAKKQPAPRSVLGKTGGLRILVDSAAASGKSSSSSHDHAVAEWRQKYESMVAEKKRLESDLQAKQILVDELTAQVNAMEQATNAEDTTITPLSDPMETRDQMEDENETETAVNATTTMTSVAGGHPAATVAESLASGAQPTAEARDEPEKSSKADAKPSEGVIASKNDNATDVTKTTEQQGTSEEDMCMGVPVVDSPSKTPRLSESSKPLKAADSTSLNTNTAQTSDIESDSSSTKENQAPKAPTPVGLGSLTTAQLLRFEALSRLPAHHELPVDGTPEEIIASLRQRIQVLQQNRSEEINELRTYRKYLLESDDENQVLRVHKAALEEQVRELEPLQGYVVTSEILRECERLDAACLRAELVKSREDSAVARLSITKIGEAFKKKIASMRARIAELRAAERAQRERADESEFASEISAQQVTEELELVRETYDRKIAALEKRLKEVEAEEGRARGALETRQRELVSDNESLRAQLKRAKRSRSPDDDSSSSSPVSPKRRRMMPAHSKTPPPPTSHAPLAAPSTSRPTHALTPPVPSTRKRTRAQFEPPGQEGSTTSSSNQKSSKPRIEDTSQSQSSVQSDAEHNESATSSPPGGESTPKPTPSDAADESSSLSESLRLVREASDTMFDSVRDLKSHLAEIQELLAQSPSKSGVSVSIEQIKDQLSVQTESGDVSSSSSSSADA